ncbi:MAG: HAMP domain-containing histidine kinase [Candidatus Rokubacteria bacterium]|nr:HAMP domain-containing histidine kinase [Candidatus Rokubacteria bacterium]
MARLHSRIYLHSLGVLLAVGLAVSIVFALGGREPFARAVAERATRHAARLVAESWGDESTLRHRVRQLHEDLEVDVVVRDAAERVVETAGKPRPAPAELASARAGEIAIGARRRPLAAGAVRDPTSGALLGTVELYPGRPFGPPVPWRPLLAVGVVLLVVGTATRPLARRLSRPLERLTEAARRLGAGELSSRVPTAPARRRSWPRRHGSTDEIEELTRAFNDMAERLERLVRDQKELLANVSHEFRSPLARIRVALELLPRAVGDEAKLSEVEADLAELDRLIEAILTTSRLEATGAPPHPGPVDLRVLLAEVAGQAARDPRLAGQAISVAESPALEAVADAALLRRALLNLVENAAKYGAPPIVLAGAREGERLVLSVTDQGEGVPAGERERVFAAFYRRDRARTPSAAGEPPRGWGLGLTIARRIAEVHGGTVAIGSAAVMDGCEQGCRVTISLPASDAAAPPRS